MDIKIIQEGAQFWFYEDGNDNPLGSLLVGHHKMNQNYELDPSSYVAEIKIDNEKALMGIFPNTESGIRKGIMAVESGIQRYRNGTLKIVNFSDVGIDFLKSLNN